MGRASTRLSGVVYLSISRLASERRCHGFMLRQQELFMVLAEKMDAATDTLPRIFSPHNTR